jgi:hypothetical protein
MTRRLTIALLLLATTARADKASDALSLLDKGIKDFNAGHLAEARESFAKARDLVPDKANPYRWLGLVDARMGHCGDAIKELEIFLQKVPQGDSRIAEAVTLRDRCKEDLQPRMGSLVVESTPSGAEVRLDDVNAAEVGTTPYRNDAIPAGNHVVFVRKPGFHEITRGVAVGQRETVRVELKLVAAPSVAEKPAKREPAPVATTSTEKPKKKSRAWIAGVVVGVVVAVGLGVGLGVGLTQTSSGPTQFPPVGPP